MSEVKLYRKRIIPEECILLENDEILHIDREIIVTKWNTIRPKKTLHHGYSCYFLERGFKVSKFYDHSGNSQRLADAAGGMGRIPAGVRARLGLP